MEFIYRGKTKDVYLLEDGCVLLKFKDDGTVNEDGKFDPGGNTVGVNVKDMGKANLRLTDFFYKKIQAEGIPTHYVGADIENSSMTVRRAKVFGKGLEVVCRFKAEGSFIRRYGLYAKDGQDLPAFVEVTIKDDSRGDPPITREGLEVLGIMTFAEYDEIVSLTKRICLIVKDEVAKKGAELYDIKLEFGRCEGKVILIDEISGGCMRVYKNGAAVDPLAIAEMMLS